MLRCLRPHRSAKIARQSCMLCIACISTDVTTDSCPTSVPSILQTVFAHTDLMFESVQQISLAILRNDISPSSRFWVLKREIRRCTFLLSIKARICFIHTPSIRLVLRIMASAWVDGSPRRGSFYKLQAPPMTPPTLQITPHVSADVGGITLQNGFGSTLTMASQFDERNQTNNVAMHFIGPIGLRVWRCITKLPSSEGCCRESFRASQDAQHSRIL